MSSLTNSPNGFVPMRLEKAKSFSFEMSFVVEGGAAADLTGCEINLTVKQPAHLGGATVITEAALVDIIASGYARFDLQAADTNLAAGSYPYAVTLKTAENYVATVFKGELEILDNVESAWAGEVYGGVLPPTSLTVKLLKDNSFTLELNDVNLQQPTGDSQFASILGDIGSASRAVLAGLFAPLQWLHNHTDAASGGQLTDAALSSAVTVPKGGTGQTTLTGGNFLIGNGAAPVTTAKVAPAGTVVGTTDTQTLTAKTIALGSNTISGTKAEFNAAMTDADFATIAGTETLTGKTLTSPVINDPDINVGGVDWLPGLQQVVRFTAGGSFTKASYPSMKFIRVRVVGGGGAGGGAASTGAGQSSAGSGGAAAGYAEKIIQAASLAASETVTVGTGGLGVSGAAGNAGTASSFGAHCSANGGSGGGGLMTATSTIGTSPGPNGGTSSGGDIGFKGQGGGYSLRVTASSAISGRGGAGPFGSGGMEKEASDGEGGFGYGTGGSGGANGQSSGTARTGGSGTDGIVIVEIYG